VHVEPESEPPDGHEYDAVEETVIDDDAGDVPTAFEAVVEHAYVFNGSIEETVSGEDAPEVVRVVPPFEDVQVAVYDVIGDEPEEAGAENDTTTEDPDIEPPVIAGADGAESTGAAVVVVVAAVVVGAAVVVVTAVVVVVAAVVVGAAVVVVPPAVVAVVVPVPYVPLEGGPELADPASHVDPEQSAIHTVGGIDSETIPNTARTAGASVVADAMYSTPEMTENTSSEGAVEYTESPESNSSDHVFDAVFRFEFPVAPTPSGSGAYAPVLYTGRSAVASMTACCHV
jgi:hypothetical protein